MIIVWTVTAVWLGLLLSGWKMWSNSRGQSGDTGDSITDLLLGYWLPASLFAWGLLAIWLGRSWWFDRAARLITFTEGGAVAIGIAWIATAFCFHCYVVWRQRPPLSRYADLLTLGFAITALASLAVALWLGP